MTLLVQKYGGTSLGNAERLKNVVNIIKNTRKTHEAIVVVSALSSYTKAEGTTSRLLQAAQQAIQGEDFFNTAKYPTITYRSSKLKFDGDNLAAVEGDLTVKGVTRQVTLTITSFKCMPHPMLKKDACGANATAIIKCSEFNMGKHAPYVSDELTLTIPVESVKE